MNDDPFHAVAPQAIAAGLQSLPSRPRLPQRSPGSFTEDDSTNVAALFLFYPQIDCNSGDTSVARTFEVCQYSSVIE
ncbi:hypothetical protein [Candidatus Phyllobacterium onerii]|uniref:hypothetical protein n=1 Tax=Candidatus Phyllobacterium onerii TaxID=3020828 RepID=UPI00232DC8D7|nr:hypothetical protein [Phyllobacterium sp. IY22]